MPAPAPTADRRPDADDPGDAHGAAFGPDERSFTFIAEGLLCAARNNVSHVFDTATTLMLPRGMPVLAAVRRRRLAQAETQCPPGQQRVVRLGDGELWDRAVGPSASSQSKTPPTGAAFATLPIRWLLFLFLNLVVARAGFEPATFGL